MLGGTQMPPPGTGAALLSGGTPSTCKHNRKQIPGRRRAGKSRTILSCFVLRQKQQVLPRSAPAGTREQYCGNTSSLAPAGNTPPPPACLTWGKTSPSSSPGGKTALLRYITVAPQFHVGTSHGRSFGSSHASQHPTPPSAPHIASQDRYAISRRCSSAIQAFFR